MVPVGSSVMLELVLAVDSYQDQDSLPVKRRNDNHSPGSLSCAKNHYHVIAYLDYNRLMCQLCKNLKKVTFEQCMRSIKAFL